MDTLITAPKRSIPISILQKNMNPMNGMCSCPHHKMVWILMVVFGLIFFLGNLNILTQSAVTMIWPIVVMAGGLIKITGNRCKCCSKDAGTCMNCGKDGCACK